MWLDSPVALNKTIEGREINHKKLSAQTVKKNAAGDNAHYRGDGWGGVSRPQCYRVMYFFNEANELFQQEGLM